MRRLLVAVPVSIMFVVLLGPLARAYDAAPDNQTCRMEASLVRGEKGQGQTDLRAKWEVTAPEKIKKIKAVIAVEELPNGSKYRDKKDGDFSGENYTEKDFKDFTVDNVNAAHRGFVELEATLIDASTCSANLQVRIAKAEG